ncbi:MAG: MiaB/RimO family radical SAM methylthiotransferase [Candidatus Gracilibacteria bacterium]|jgi:threonylcarbamoyladenosine tRNA methylthiotransferase MtaB|nr:MiaB/RimO family radical SAM methylthiotransferase [Candidatus Gracilibacteria bacterium]
MKIGIKTLGCKSNRYESDRVFDELILQGHKVVEIDEMPFSFKEKSDFSPDLFIVNTCTVTHLADTKSRKAIFGFKKAFPCAKICVFGCGVNIGSISEEISEIDFFAKNRDELIRFIVEQNCCSTNGGEFSSSDSETGERTRTLIKIQDGCENFCTYCIIAKARGKERSFSSREIIAELIENEEKGFKEAIITGINIGKWKEGDMDFTDLLELMISSTKKINLRISSIEPVEFPNNFFELFSSPRLSPQIHLSLQSGSDKILKLMNRHYTSSDYLKICEKLYNSNPDFAINTDVIVGFPGESDKDFSDTVDFVKKVGFLKVHTFPYSKRNKTPAAHFPNQVHPLEKKSRSKTLREISDELGRNFMEKYIGKSVSVLVEGNKGMYRKGFTSNLLPVRFSGEENLRNSFVNVLISGIDKSGKFLIGKLEQ